MENPTRTPARSALVEQGAGCGRQALWVNRYHLPFDESGTQPTGTGHSLHAVLNFFKHIP